MCRIGRSCWRRRRRRGRFFALIALAPPLAHRPVERTGRSRGASLSGRARATPRWQRAFAPALQNPRRARPRRSSRPATLRRASPSIATIRAVAAIEALKAQFPTVLRLVGDEAFRGAARAFEREDSAVFAGSRRIWRKISRFSCAAFLKSRARPKSPICPMSPGSTGPCCKPCARGRPSPARLRASRRSTRRPSQTRAPAFILRSVSSPLTGRCSPCATRWEARSTIGAAKPRWSFGPGPKPV